MLLRFSLEEPSGLGEFERRLRAQAAAELCHAVVFSVHYIDRRTRVIGDI
jgi:hypothetical protein